MAKREAVALTRLLEKPEPRNTVALETWRLTVAIAHPEECQKLQRLYRLIDEHERQRDEVQRRLSRYDDPSPHLARAGVFREHQGGRLRDFPKLTEQLQRWIAAEATDVRASCLLVNGPVGTGKSRLAAAILADVLRVESDTGRDDETYSRLLDFGPRFMLARRLLNDLWNESGVSGGSLAMNRLTALPWLVIDDLGHEGRVSEAAIGAFHELLSIRCGNYQRTILTTNLSLEEIGKTYDPSIASRLASWTQIVLTGPDRRRA